ncbi:peptidoglycan/xylan/chitin deacetylase (PgdA/CDA1 family) [Flavobacterium arsenatis]|uniref:Peptidoglycan/xylan/chitin deacetylase (PgdA/CDA1 family) n=1 Tax=Flavobacterium arsenatis TaxID=1484332 RepID=A0ABU1TTI4_9FLAO|nr:polysaccharide deacetylase family protein [Flavobacterium arsenatis]MDR6969195.1 peptidoglycan/xylan/chitin deacetylase (PgdA/CDA1 family) [Flavobacterium arsenatis]
MKFYWIKTHFIVKKIFSRYVWDLPNQEKKVYLTFDDGPTPEITEWTLNQLKQYDAKATFFCIGENIQKHPEIFSKIINEGHSIGNHTFNHLNGWKTSTEDYIENFKQCEDEILKQLHILNLKSKIYNLKSNLFRPPYGKIKFAQSRIMRKMGYKIIMWDVLSADFDTNVSPEKCLENVIKNIRSGSIIIFHDSIKASKNLEHALPKTLAFLKENGYKCEAI